MSYYGVSILITILVTSLIAFYFLYKAKELNVGIVISISIGSIILGFTFSPIFKAVMELLNDNININKKISIIVSLLTVLFVFLLFILIISFIISISIPKKLTSIDCCVIINRTISRIKIKAGIINLKDKLGGFFMKIGSNMKEIVKNVYNLINKLKKPVDTKQIIDTMGIEKNENGLNEKSINTIDATDSVAFANLIGFMEPSSQEINYAGQDSTADEDIIDQTLEVNDSAYENLAAVAFQEIVADQVSDIPANEVDKDVLNDLSEIVVENQVVESEIVETDAVESEVPQFASVAAELKQILPSIQNAAVDFELDDNVIDNIEYGEEIDKSESIFDASSLVLKALESKDAGRKEDAIECYIEALQYEPNNEMLFWIVLDICALYKQLGLSELAKNILEGLVSQYGAAIQPEVKMEIMNYLK
ncbi:MAG: hypothetical protein ACYDG2_09860 [Ruminiclostridium sp.]